MKQTTEHAPHTNNEVIFPLTIEAVQNLRQFDQVSMTTAQFMDFVAPSAHTNFFPERDVPEYISLTVTANNKAKRTISRRYQEHLEDLREQLGDREPRGAMGVLTLSYDELVGVSLENVLSTIVQRVQKMVRHKRD